MHMPIFTEAEEADWSRHTEPTLNLVAGDKRARILAMDETKRALEAAEADSRSAPASFTSASKVRHLVDRNTRSLPHRHRTP